MEKIPSAHLLPALLAFLLLQGVLNIQARSLVGSGNQVLQSNDDALNRLFALLLHKSITPDQDDVIGLDLAGKIAELQELQALRDEVKLQKQLTSRAADRASSQPNKRGDACFWKYCV